MKRAILVLSILATLAVLMPFVGDGDFWFHLRTGQLEWQTYSIISTKLFSYTQSGAPWPNHEWLAQLGIYAAYTIGGFPVVGLLVALLGAAVFSILWFRAQHGWLTYPTLLLCAFALREFFVPRPQVLAYLLAALLLLALERYRVARARRWLYLGVATMFAWGNLHASVVIGAGVWLVWECAELVDARRTTGTWRGAAVQRRTALIVFTAGILGSCINPAGIDVYVYGLQPLQYAAAYHSLRETQSFLHALKMNGMLLGLALHALFGVAIGYGVKRKSVALPALVVAVVAWFAPFVAVKYLPFSWMIAAPIALGGVPENLAMHRLWVWLAVVLAILGIVYGSVQHKSFQNPYDQWPEDLVSFVQDVAPTGNMYNSYTWGGYLAWRMSEHPVFIWGGCVCFYDVEYFEGLDFAKGERIEELTEKYHFAYAVVRPWETLAYVLSIQPDWALVYWDNFGMVYVRRGTGNDDLIRKYEMRIPYINDSLDAILRKVGSAKLPALIQQYEEALRRSGSLRLARFQLGSILQATGNCPAAISQWQQLVAQDVSLGSAHARLAQCYATLGRRSDAVAEQDLARRYAQNQRWWFGRE